eukprot:jgi/Astpho2/4728/Aster-00282
MNRIFGKRKEKAPDPTLDEANDRMDKRGTVLQEKIRKLDEQLKGHREQIKRCRPGPAQEAAKRRALQVGFVSHPVLKSKRMYENQLGALTNQQFNVEQTNFALQSMQDNVQTVRAMQAAGKQLKQNFKQPELNINKIENMQDDMADLMLHLKAPAERVVGHLRCLQDRNQEIQDVLGQNFGVPDDIDEDELMGELDALEDDMATELDAGPGGVPSYMQVGAATTSVPAFLSQGKQFLGLM